MLKVTKFVNREADLGTKTDDDGRRQRSIDQIG